MGVLLFAFSGFAQNQTKKRWNAASLDGTTGLFKVWDAEALRHGETNWTFGYDQLNRYPGKLTVGRAVTGVSIGLWDRFEFAASVDIQRHIKAVGIEPYSIYPQVTPYSDGSSPDPQISMLTDGYRSSNQIAPFMDVPVSNGRSDFHFSAKYNIFSERRGDPVSLALTGFGTVPASSDCEYLNRGLTSGAYQGGFAWLLSKTLTENARMHFNVGTNLYSNPTNDSFLADVQHEFYYRVGAELPAYKRLRFIGEFLGTKYYGQATENLNPKSPVDIIAGVRYYAKEWLTFGGGYQLTLHQTTANGLEDKNGFVVQGTLGTRRNDPPTVTCAVAKPSILQGDTTTVRASAVDPDGDRLTYSWTASGGKVDGAGDTVTFNATGLAPGKYTVTNTVADKKHQASCSADITVLKRNIAPTAAIEPTSCSLIQGESANFKCIGSDGNNDPLTYSWTIDGQKIAASGPQATFGSEGRKPGSYAIQCSVSDGEASASVTANCAVKERAIPNKPPTINCQTATMDVASGASIELRAKASDPDGDNLTYSWTASGGSVSGSGETATFNATGVKAGSYTVTVTVTDSKGAKASCSMTVNVSERLSVTKEKCGYFAVKGARVDNCAKAILDDLAVRMKNDPKLKANVIGYTDGSKTEAGVKGLGEKRAKAMVEYLEKQGVESSRLTATDGGANNPVGDNKTADGRTLNRRVEIELSVR
jgi:outer membrane protein OmpA-like peptidoglycan-associated protein